MPKETMTPFDKIDIHDILPQRPPFVMIEKLLHVDDRITRTALHVREDNIFCEDGQLTESGVIENIAQTCAARMGYINKYVSNDTVKLGFIGSLRNMEIVRLPLAGETLVTQIDVREEIFRMTLVDATVRVGDELIASSEMKISVTDIARRENE
ncbi:MAG: pseudouridylate synthase [Tannerella sp.]|jgi:predicted hotdog family 3-hydroxylacyl-ACP dehydratase|nr:pseudouridylate synthase [Tannerella sp.]